MERLLKAQQMAHTRKRGYILTCCLTRKQKFDIAATCFARPDCGGHQFMRAGRRIRGRGNDQQAAHGVAVSGMALRR